MSYELYFPHKENTLRAALARVMFSNILFRNCFHFSMVKNHKSSSKFAPIPFDVYNPHIMLVSPKKILVQRADRVGDVILSLPAIESLFRIYPDAEIHFLTSSIGKRCVDGHPLLDRIFVAEFSEKGLKNEAVLLERLREEAYDCYIALWHNLPLARLTKKAKIPMRIGDGSKFPDSLYYTHPAKPNWSDITRHQIELNHDLLQPLGIASQFVQAQLPISSDADIKADSFFKKWVSPEKKVVTICASTGGSNQPLPEEALLAFIKLLGELRSFTVILDGHVSETSVLYNFQDTHVMNVMGQLSLQELAAVIKRSDYYVGPDTGPTHMASMLGVPSLIFSSRKSNPPSHWGTLSKYSVYIRKDYDCTFFCSKKCFPDTCFSYVTGPYLLEKFGELVYQKEMNEGRSLAEQKQYLSLLSLRILYPVISFEEYDIACKTAATLQGEGLYVFPVLLPSWSIRYLPFLVKQVIRYNINVIQGDIPTWMVSLIRLYMGAIAVYVKPAHLKLPLYPDVPAIDMVPLYVRACQNS